MVKFLLKGLIRDRSRSVFPIIIVIIGVALSVFLHSWIKGVTNEMINTNASFDTGHVKIMSRAYAELSDQIPNDLALIDLENLMNNLNSEYPELAWTPRIRFGGLLDFPDEDGETREQGTVFGIAVDLLSENSPEYYILNLNDALVQGKLPQKPGEIVISEQFAQKTNTKIGDHATLISSTMYGSMAFYNFTVSGTVRFGIGPMDKGAMIVDIFDIQIVLNMENATGEILGFYPNYIYQEENAEILAKQFNKKYSKIDDEFSPLMKTLREQSGLGQILDMTKYMSGIIIGIFIFAMSIVLWNAGLMGSLRRYGEIGLRMALGENKRQVYHSMIYESLMIGLFGSVLGTGIGLLFAYYLQNHGVDFGSMMKSSSMLVSNVFRAQVTTTSYYIGFFPGLLATTLGTMISGIGIYKRQTSQLFKELET